MQESLRSEYHQYVNDCQKYIPEAKKMMNYHINILQYDRYDTTINFMHEVEFMWACSMLRIHSLGGPLARPSHS